MRTGRCRSRGRGRSCPVAAGRSESIGSVRGRAGRWGGWSSCRVGDERWRRRVVTVRRKARQRRHRGAHAQARHCPPPAAARGRRKAVNRGRAFVRKNPRVGHKRCAVAALIRTHSGSSMILLANWSRSWVGPLASLPLLIIASFMPPLPAAAARRRCVRSRGVESGARRGRRRRCRRPFGEGTKSEEDRRWGLRRG